MSATWEMQYAATKGSDAPSSPSKAARARKLKWPLLFMVPPKFHRLP